MTTRTTRILLTLLAGAALLAPAMPAQAARAAASDTPVTLAPGATTFTVVGHGWGHGHGMSQYGAQGAARAGLTTAQILDFYYPGTTPSTLSTGIRVLITGDTDNNTTVLPTRGLRVVDYGRGGRSFRLPTTKNPKAWRLATVNGRTRVFYRTAKWHLYRTGGRVALAGTGEFRSRAGLVTLKLPSGPRPYRGALRYTNRDTVNVLSLENYLKGVVASEMPPSWKPAALGAQAVAARTYAARERADHLTGYYQICDTTRCQVYKGYGAETATTNAAVAATAGQIRTFGGQVAFTQFSSSSGGWTSDGGQPYLPAKQDIYDKPVDPVAHIGDPNFDWTVTARTAVLEKAYPSIGTVAKLQVMAREGNRTYANGGRVEQVLVTGSTGSVLITGSTFRSLYGLRSTYFDITVP